MKKFLIVFLVFGYCSSSNGGESTKGKAKPEYDLVSVEKESSKELTLVMCGSFVYFPFGKIDKPDDLQASRLKDFAVKKTITPENKITLFSLQNGTDRLTLHFRELNEEGPIGSYVVKGEINSRSAWFLNGLHIGMSQSEFFGLFFESYPHQWKNLEAVQFDSCVADVRHIYSFSKGHMANVKFECVDCAFK